MLYYNLWLYQLIFVIYYTNINNTTTFELSPCDCFLARRNEVAETCGSSNVSLAALSRVFKRSVVKRPKLNIFL